MACIAAIPLQALECVESSVVHRRLPSFLVHNFPDMFPHGVFYQPIEYLGPVQKKDSLVTGKTMSITSQSSQQDVARIDASDKKER